MMNSFGAAVLVSGAMLLAAGSGPAWADAAQGEKNFNRCMVCHTLKEGQNRVGPSLHEVFGRKAGTVDKYKYSDGLKKAAEKGLVWTRENLMAYLKDPREFLREFTGDPKARNKMTMKFPQEQFRKDVIDYLESLAPKKDDAGKKEKGS